MAIEFSGDIQAAATIYDCMDELSAFSGASASMRENERALFKKADLVFTGGRSLYESKKKQHSAVYAFPSSVDVSHFRRARSLNREPEDQRHIARPRIGYAGVIDERMDLQLLESIAQARPDWQFILLGPIVKIDPASIPRLPNIHCLGMKPYSELPAYFSGWDIGMLPFALNESTRYISPTKTPEYLAAGLKVISTAIRDVVTPYGDLGLVHIATSPSGFVNAADSMLRSPSDVRLRAQVDEFLSSSSWDKTWREMNELIEKELVAKHLPLNKVGAMRATEGLLNV
jgi:UDP-galactopyranose mutase